MAPTASSAPSCSITALLASPDVFPLILPPRISPPPSLDAHAWLLDDDTEYDLPSSSAAATTPTPPLLHLLPPDGDCACAYDTMPTNVPGRLVAPAPQTHGPRSGGPRAFHMSEERTLLRIVAPVRMPPVLHIARALAGACTSSSSSARQTPPRSGGPRAFHMSEERTLLRIVAPVRMPPVLHNARALAGTCTSSSQLCQTNTASLPSRPPLHTGIRHARPQLGPRPRRAACARGDAPVVVRARLAHLHRRRR